MLNVLRYNFPVTDKIHLLADLQKSGEIFPPTRCRKNLTIHSCLHLIKALRFCGEE